jgi:hypothetical protein
MRGAARAAAAVRTERRFNIATPANRAGVYRRGARSLYSFGGGLKLCALRHVGLAALYDRLGPEERGDELGGWSDAEIYHAIYRLPG